MRSELPRTLIALVTPFHQSGELDLDAHRHNIKHLSQLGAAGVLIGGSTGEGPYLEPGERRKLIETAKSTVPEGHVMAGIAAETVRLGQSQLEEAALAGADTALVLTPTTMSRGDPDAVIRYYRTLAADAPLPLLLYSVPRWTGYELPEAAVEKLTRVEGIVGMKDSGGDIRRIARLAAAVPPGCCLYNGSSAVLAQAIWSGAHGAITASGNYVPMLVRRVVTDGRLDDQRRLAGIAAAVERGGIPAIKAAADVAGMRSGWPRSPLVRPTAEEYERIATLVGG